MHWYTPKEEHGTQKLFMGLARNDITINNKGGAARNNSKEFLQASSLVLMLTPILPKYPSLNGAFPTYSNNLLHYLIYRKIITKPVVQNVVLVLEI